MADRMSAVFKDLVSGPEQINTASDLIAMGLPEADSRSL